jgi:predicted phage terminase large subunit-like protein
MNYTEEQLKQILVQVERTACTESFYEFLVSFWEVIVEEPLEDNWHIRYLCNELQKLSRPIIARQPKLYDICINIPPGTTKSTITTIMYPAWLWTQDPSIRIITNSYSSDLSIEHAVKSRDIILSDKYKKLFPEIELRHDKAAKGSYENVKKGARYTTSTGGTITGKHAHIIINDDPLNPKQAVSKVQREEANTHTKTLSSRKVNKENTPVITIMQRLHINDVSGYLLEKKARSTKHICLPARKSSNVKPAHLVHMYKGGLLDPNRLSERVLAEALEDLGSRDFAGQYGQTPTEIGGNIFKRDWFPRVSRREFERIRGSNTIHFFSDTAFTEKTENDPTGTIAVCLVGNKIFITHAEKVRLKFPDLCRHLPTYVMRQGYTSDSTVRIEPKANGISVIDQLQESTGLNVTRTPTPKESKEVRANAASPKVECGRVLLVEGDWNSDFLDEVCGFPRHPHDEYVDVLGYAIDHFLNDMEEWIEKEMERIEDFF